MKQGKVKSNKFEIILHFDLKFILNYSINVHFDSLECLIRRGVLLREEER